MTQRETVPRSRFVLLVLYSRTTFLYSVPQAHAHYSSARGPHGPVVDFWKSHTVILVCFPFSAKKSFDPDIFSRVVITVNDGGSCAQSTSDQRVGEEVSHVHQ